MEKHAGYVEYTYDEKDVSLNDAANAVLKGVINLIENGKYIDETQKAKFQEYPYEDEQGNTRFRVGDDYEAIEGGVRFKIVDDEEIIKKFETEPIEDLKSVKAEAEKPAKPKRRTKKATAKSEETTAAPEEVAPKAEETKPEVKKEKNKGKRFRVEEAASNFTLTQDNAVDFEYAVMNSISDAYSARGDYKQVKGVVVRVKDHTPNWSNFLRYDEATDEYVPVSDKILNVTIGDYNNTDYRRAKADHDEFVVEYPDVKAVNVEIEDGTSVADALEQIHTALKEKGIDFEFESNPYWVNQYSAENNDLSAGGTRFSVREDGDKKEKHSKEDSQDLTTIIVSSKNADVKIAISKEIAKNNLDNLLEYLNTRNTRGFLGDLKRALGETKTQGQSSYFDFNTNNGNVTLRISNHNANAANARGDRDVISVIIKSERTKNRFKDAEGVNDLTTPENAVRELGKKIKLEKSLSSQSYYGEFYEGDFLVGGRKLNLRVSTHPASGQGNTRFRVVDDDYEAIELRNPTIKIIFCLVRAKNQII